ncbi:hypothetical protein Taro_018792 [Colocasia esculenta]|uniref:Uncharacterized protein n=1 Tax=Colocasia esculenta TaxID=4460 RepID=A0A843V066_COLES|nr:hypothetical protein [Colocasia esculenta]
MTCGVLARTEHRGPAYVRTDGSFTGSSGESPSNAGGTRVSFFPGGSGGFSRSAGSVAEKAELLVNLEAFLEASWSFVDLSGDFRSYLDLPELSAMVLGKVLQRGWNGPVAMAARPSGGPHALARAVGLARVGAYRKRVRAMRKNLGVQGTDGYGVRETDMLCLRTDGYLLQIYLATALARWPGAAARVAPALVQHGWLSARGSRAMEGSDRRPWIRLLGGKSLNRQTSSWIDQNRGYMPLKTMPTADNLGPYNRDFDCYTRSRKMAPVIWNLQNRHTTAMEINGTYLMPGDSRWYGYWSVVPSHIFRYGATEWLTSILHHYGEILKRSGIYGAVEAALQGSLFRRISTAGSEEAFPGTIHLCPEGYGLESSAAT